MTRGRIPARMKRLLPWGVVALVLLWVVSAWLPRKERGGYDLYAFGSLPVQHEGRLKPLDTVARSTLLSIRSKQTVRTDEGKISATRWFLDMAARPDVADDYKVFVIDDPEVLGILGLEPKGRYYTMNQIRPHLEEVDRQAEHAMGIEHNQRTRFQRAVIGLREKLIAYQRLQNTLQVSGTHDFAAELERFQALAASGAGALDMHQSGGGGQFDNPDLADWAGMVQNYRFLAQAAYFMPLPPLSGGADGGWWTMGDGLTHYLDAHVMHPAVPAYAAMLTAWHGQDAAAFNQALRSLRTSMAADLPVTAGKASREARFNLVQPFSLGMAVYIMALLAAFVSWMMWPEVLGTTAFRLLVLAFALHTGGLATRIILEGRPPVTNLYSSAVFVGWAAVGIGIVLERLYRRGIGTATAAAAGFATLIVAHHLAATGDTMEMMRAVLNSNFWLATHVITITLGYSGAFLAGFLAIVFIFRGIFTRTQDPGSTRDMERMIYGVLAFTIVFSFVGTVLGGIWADQSWGRFWGWDPKENGALLIVLWTAIALHARSARYVGPRGLALLAVGGNIITSFSWFGVNMLGIGLHSYGFMDGAFLALSVFMASQLAIIALGSLPARYWRSSPELRTRSGAVKRPGDLPGAGKGAGSRGSDGKRAPSGAPASA